MDYLYENLDDERFQELCSVLISTEFSNMQAFPVGQPDGGRDAVHFEMDSSKKSFIVFQVKFVRNAKTIGNIHKWLTDVLKKEVPKVQKLIPEGAMGYYLLTNVAGTAHLEDGTIDKVNQILRQYINVPSQCWWRDDLSRRLEKNPMIKWSFLEILNGQDILNSLVFQQINENTERRLAVLSAYLSDQYRIDNEVKFKQIELQNKLIDLYTDVPLRVKQLNHQNKQLLKRLDRINDPAITVEIDDFNPARFFGKETSTGWLAANFLLCREVQYGIERILLEGGPGQGKSTISQYICQVHRTKLLNKQDVESCLPEFLRHCPVRIPFKIDLRHIASWVEGKNPYATALNDEKFNQIWSKNLESFMIGHILYHSPNSDFKIEDFHAIIRFHPVLIVFDGFDEIADIKIRHSVIEFIDNGINRLKPNAGNIQVVITSRPAAFSNAGGFPIETYPHFELTDITSACTEKYVDKWIKANKLDSRESSEIRRLVEEKLKISHLRELAKSPMQLAIFINLLRTRGESLPNKRTALYDSYIDLFFNREAEKNQTIRDKRDLIIDIHKYLAWVLHSEAELLKNNGTISSNDLIDRLKTYLQKEGHSTDIADSLFQAMEERVCALVSRVQGTYEFEVQPLREYFCAKYLYETAPYSPVGKEKNGTKPERFNAIARDFYWNNVVRFYAGCFDKGELPMLVDELKELQQDKLLKYTNYPRLLTSQLLSDWVFTQYPKYFKDVVDIIVDGINIGNIINQSNRFMRSDEPILLPNECGRIEVIEQCVKQLRKFPHNDYAAELIGLITNNPHEKVLDLWKAELNDMAAEETALWLEYAYRMRIFHKIDAQVLSEIILSDQNDVSRIKKIQLILDSGRFDVFELKPDLKRLAIAAILSGRTIIMLRPNRKPYESSLQLLATLVNPYIIDNIIYDKYGGRFVTHIDGPFLLRKTVSGGLEIQDADDLDAILRRMSVCINRNLHSRHSLWTQDIHLWNAYLEAMRNSFGDQWSFKILSILSAKLASRNFVDERYADLTDSSVALCKRAAYAFFYARRWNYWKQQFDKRIDLLYVCLAFFSWATKSCLEKLSGIIVEIVAAFSPEDLNILSKGLSSTIHRKFFTPKQAQEIIDSEYFGLLPQDVQYLICRRFPQEQVYKVFNNVVVTAGSVFQLDIMELQFEFMIREYLNDAGNKDLLKKIKKYYHSLPNYRIDDTYIYHRFIHYSGNSTLQIPIEIARDIMKESRCYPRIIASMAEKSCRLYANEHLSVVGKVADRDKWFE